VTKGLLLAAFLILSAGCATHTSIVVAPTDSMQPTFMGGERLRIERTPFDQLRAGDIVVYYRDGMLIVHRLVAMRSDGSWTVKGDHNDGPDVKSVMRDNYYGRVSGIMAAHWEWTFGGRSGG
jgi:signal peptidase I